MNSSGIWQPGSAIRREVTKGPLSKCLRIFLLETLPVTEAFIREKRLIQDRGELILLTKSIIRLPVILRMNVNQ